MRFHVLFSFLVWTARMDALPLRPCKAEEKHDITFPHLPVAFSYPKIEFVPNWLFSGRAVQQLCGQPATGRSWRAVAALNQREGLSTLAAYRQIQRP